ncbi:MAG: GTPase, partial [Legionellaceae bacterium]|nr:GTPase [Legionellaceae bacterium]
MLPVIVLVGQPNVGKSTLFNRMTGTRTALVADFPGLTRDRQYGRATWRGTEIMLVDTGGIGVEDHNVDTLMGAQSTLALQEADLILFVVDARMGKTAQEEHIAERLRKLNKPVLLVVNKVDGVKDVVVSTEFQSFGFAEYAAVSAVHGRGIDSLWSLILGKLPRDRLAEAWPEDTPPPEGIRVAFVGRPNVGKSTLMNRILGYERVVVYDLPGTT